MIVPHWYLWLGDVAAAGAWARAGCLGAGYSALGTRPGRLPADHSVLGTGGATYGLSWIHDGRDQIATPAPLSSAVDVPVSVIRNNDWGDA